LSGACLALLTSAPAALGIPSPPVPEGLEVDPGYKLYRVDHAVGTQNFVCRSFASAPFFGWAPFGPQATLFNDHDRQIATHFLSANPDEDGEHRPTWQDSRDTSSIWAKLSEMSSDPDFVEPGAIPWLLLEVVGRSVGPTHGRRLVDTAYLQRVNTSGGLAPTTGCSEAEDVGDKALVPYTADYLFYKPIGRIE
jgi:hypothetical protein